MKRISKIKWYLIGLLAVIAVLIGSSALMPNAITNTVEFLADNNIASNLRSLWQEEVPGGTLIEMDLDSISVGQLGYQPIVILKEKGGEFYLPIWIGLLEADAISVVLRGVQTPRPLTSDLLCSIIDNVDASVDYIIISDLQDQTFYARMVLTANWMQIEFDARPSDAIAVALRVGAPIYVDKGVLDRAGIKLDRDKDEDTAIAIEMPEQPLDTL